MFAEAAQEAGYNVRQAEAALQGSPAHLVPLGVDFVGGGGGVKVEATNRRQTFQQG